MGKKSDEKKLFHVMYLRIDGNTRQRLDAKAQLEDCSASETVRNAIAEYLDKDTDWQGQMEGNMARIFKEIQGIKKEIQLFSELWLHWTEFYFTYTRSLGEMTDAQRQLLVQEGKRRSQLMLESFKKVMRERKPSLVESMLADYLVEDVL
ncbi:MAG: hypothetical protein J6R96_00475 [Spirochaetaceae bacterium]|nr:hypothetical protein [Spirochaetaceae bacterium]